MKNKSIEFIDKISSHIFKKFRYYTDKYDITGSTLTIYPYNDDRIPGWVRRINGIAATSFNVSCNDNGIIYDIQSSIFIPMENVFKKFIDFNLNYYSCTEYFDMILLHEIGHIIYARENFIGKTLNEVNEFDEIDEELRMRIPDLRKNASIYTRTDWIKKYFSLPVESGANDSVGISIEDIINMETKIFR